MRYSPCFLPHTGAIALAITVVALAPGCTLAPTYQRPELPVENHWPKEYEQSATLNKPRLQTASVSDIAWQDFFIEPTLQRLITLSLANNRDLRVAALTIEKARAQYQIQRANLFPAIGVNGNGTAQRTPSAMLTPGQTMINHQYAASVGFSAYELDLFGRLRSLNEQALENYFATEQVQRSTQISLITEVANAWYTLLADRKRLVLANQALDAHEQAFELTQIKLALGAASEQDLNQAEAQMESDRVEVANYTNQVARDKHALTLLAGSPIPEEWLSNTTLEQCSDLPELPVGLPSDILLTRPDILAAEHQLKAANANIGAARANFFPRISLTGTAGSASTALSDLFKAGSGAWTFTNSIALPIFTGGSNMATLEAAKVQRDIAIAQYEKAIQTAFREVSDTLVQHDTVAEQWEAQQLSAEAIIRNAALTEKRYQTGVDSYFTLLNAKLNMYSAQQSLVASRLAKITTQATLYKVLGGGWQSTATPNEENKK